MAIDPIQTLRWSARPWLVRGCHVITVRGRDASGEAYDYNHLVDVEDYKDFWSIIREMQAFAIEEIT